MIQYVSAYLVSNKTLFLKKKEAILMERLVCMESLKSATLFDFGSMYIHLA